MPRDVDPTWPEASSDAVPEYIPECSRSVINLTRHDAIAELMHESALADLTGEEYDEYALLFEQDLLPRRSQ